MVGAIFKGKVQNLEPGLKAAFVDIGQEKNAFLHYWDMLPGANNDPSIEIVRENKKKGSGKNEVKSVKDIPKAFPIGSEIIVQITKAQIGSRDQEQRQTFPFQVGFWSLCLLLVNVEYQEKLTTKMRETG